MDEAPNPNPSTGAQRRERQVARADQMVRSGRLTDQEAERLRSARGQAEFDDVVRTIRVRHAGEKLRAGVADGSVTAQEDDGFLDRLKNGEHSGALRAQLSRLLHQNSPPERGQDDMPDGEVDP